MHMLKSWPLVPQKWPSLQLELIADVIKMKSTWLGWEPNPKQLVSLLKGEPWTLTRHTELCDHESRDRGPVCTGQGPPGTTRREETTLQQNLPENFRRNRPGRHLGPIRGASKTARHFLSLFRSLPLWYFVMRALGNQYHGHGSYFIFGKEGKFGASRKRQEWSSENKRSLFTQLFPWTVAPPPGLAPPP